MQATISAREAGRVLSLHPHTIAKMKDAGLLTGPPDQPGRRAGIYSASLDTAAAVLPAAVRAGDIAFHLGPLSRDPDRHGGRAYAGWHQDASFTLPVAQRRQCWAGVWNIDRAQAHAHAGHHAVATVGGFIVDIAAVTGAGTCPCCGLVVFDLHDPAPEAVATYRGRRLTVPRGSLWTR